MAPAYKLTYFNGKGLTEPVRFLLKYGNIDFEDCRIEKDQWPELKATTPFGLLPTLEHNGKIVTESTAMCRYFGRELNLAGSNNWENLEVDAIADTIVDMRGKMGVVFKETDEKIKEKKMAQLLNEILPPMLEKLDQHAKKNNGHLALGKLTWADMLFAAYSELFNMFTGKKIFENYANLNQVILNVTSLPAIKKWIAERPVTEY